jgi:hypothetical protein
MHSESDILKQISMSGPVVTQLCPEYRLAIPRSQETRRSDPQRAPESAFQSGGCERDGAPGTTPSPADLSVAEVESPD